MSLANADDQRSHYRTDWHRYNLKRKVAELPPVSAETFQLKVLAQRADAAVPKAGPQFCQACKKKFSSEKVYTEHVKSKKHKANQKAYDEQEVNPADIDVMIEERLESYVKEQEETAKKTKDAENSDDDMEVIEGGEEDPIEATECLFCHHDSRDVEDNVKHMARSHSFFIPDIEFLVDLKGFLEYLGAKVGSGHVCLWCCKQFSCREAVVQHMADRGHSMLHYDQNSAEFVDFYDYRSSYPESERGKTQTHGEASDADEDDEAEVEASLVEVADNTGELVLPSGARAGHRSLNRYYKQSLRPGRMQVTTADKVQRLIMQYKAIGWGGSLEVVRLANEKRRRDGDALVRRQQQHSAQLGWKANKLQKTYRRQVFLW